MQLAGSAAGGLGFGSAGEAAGASAGFGGLSTILNAGGDVAKGIGGFQQDSYQAQVLANNATIMRQNAAATVEAGSYEESVSKERTGQLVGQERAAQGANNIDVNVGSPVAVRSSSEAVGAMDAAMIHYNAARTAYGQELEASALTAQSNLEKSSAIGSIFGGLFNAGSSFLSGASSVGSKYAGFQLSGAGS